MTNSYALETLKKEEARLLDVRDILNMRGENPEQVIIKIHNIQDSIRSLEEDRVLVITGEDGSKITFNSKFGMKIDAGKIDIKSNVNVDKYKWDYLADIESEVSRIINNKWEELNNNITKDEAMNYLKKHNSKAKHDEIITRLYFNNRKDFVQDFSYFVYPFEQDKLGNVISASAYLSNELCIALKNGMTLTSDLENELNNFIIEREVTKAELRHNPSSINNITINVNTGTTEVNVNEVSKQFMKALKREKGLS